MEVSVPVIVPSPLRTISPRRVKSHADTNAPVPNVEVSAIVTVPSQSPHTSPRKAKYLGDVKAISLVLQNHFSSLDGLETTDVGGDSHIGASTIPPVGINSDHIENQVVSKFWADSNEMEEDVSVGRKQFTLKENQGDHLKGLVNPGKLLRQFFLQRRNEGLFIFLEC